MLLFLTCYDCPSLAVHEDGKYRISPKQCMTSTFVPCITNRALQCESMLDVAER